MPTDPGGNTNSANMNDNSSANANDNAPANTNDNAGNDNSSGNENANANSNDNTNDNSNTITLSADQEAEIDANAALLNEASKFFSVYANLADPMLDFANLQQIGVVGNCPTVSYVSNATSGGFSLDFTADGCDSDSLAGLNASGSGGFTYDRNTEVATLSFDNLVIDAEAVTGTGTPVVTGNGTIGVTMNGQFDILVGGKMISGEVIVLLLVDGSVQINGTGLSIDDGSGAGAVSFDLNDVVVNGESNGSLRPESGSISYTNADNQMVIVTFSTATVQDGTVMVEIVGEGTTTHQFGS